MKICVLSYKLNGSEKHVNIHSKRALQRHLRECIDANLFDACERELMEVLRASKMDPKKMCNGDFDILLRQYVIYRVIEMREYIFKEYCIKDCTTDLYMIAYLLKANNLDFVIK